MSSKLICLCLGLSLVACQRSKSAPAPPVDAPDAPASIAPATEPMKVAPLTEAAEAEVKAFCPEATLNVEARALYLRSCSLSVFTVDAVAKLPWLGALDSLTLSGTSLEGDGLSRLLMHPSLAQLKSIALLNQDLDESKAEVIAKRLAKGGVRTLSFQGHAVDARSTLSAQALRLLLSPPSLVVLESLKLELFELEDDSPAVFEAMSIKVEALALNTMSLRDGLIKAMVEQGRLAGVKRLELAGNALTDEAAKALSAGSSLATSLESLDLTGNEVADAGLEALLKMPALQSLKLYNNKVTGSAIDAIKPDGALKKLDLAMCPLNDEALAKIAKIEGVEINTIE